VKSRVFHLQAALLWIFLCGCSAPPPVSTSETASRTGALPQFSVVDQETVDTAVKTQVEKHLLVTGDGISADSAEALLRSQFASVMKQGSFKHHNPPTNVYIYIYDSEEKARAGQGLWLAMLQMGPLDKGVPKITVREERIAALGEEPEMKFGLTEAQRRQAFKGIAAAEQRAMDDAIAREPNNFNLQIELETKLREENKSRLAKEYKITAEQLKEISLEGLTKQWPM